VTAPGFALRMGKGAYENGHRDDKKSS